MQSRGAPRILSAIDRLTFSIARNSLARRFFAVFLLAVALPLVAVSTAVTLRYRRFLLELATSRAAQTVAPIAEGIEEEVRRAALLAATLSTDEEFVALAERLNGARDQRERYADTVLIERRLTEFFDYTNKTGAVLLYFRDRPVFLHRNNGLLFDQPLPRGAWYETVTSAPNATVILDDLGSYGLETSARPLLKVAVCPSREALRNGFQAIVVAFRVPFLDRVAGFGPVSSEEELVLVDRDGATILARDSWPSQTPTDAPLRGPSVFRRDRSTLVAAPASIPSADWTLVSITDFSLLTRDVARMGRVAWWALIALLVAFMGYVEVFFRQVIKPIRTVIREMEKVESGHWDARVAVSGPAELALLGGGFNTMVAEVERLTVERERQERERTRLELESLRHQINPHFLTNTLGSIRMMASISNAEPIRRMTAALMRLVSAAFRGDDTLASVAEELELLEQYLLIMRVRFGDTFGVAIDVSEEVRGCRIPRMMLQPLVENAILHGLQGLKRRGEIAIRGRIEGGSDTPRVVALDVSDNGRGMDAERRSDALGGPGGGRRGVTAVGLANIRRRIALRQGDGCGIQVESTPDRGTVVRLRLPLIGEG